MKEILGDFGVPGIILPDISETLDGAAQLDYDKIPAGGTPLAAIKAMGASLATLEFGRTLFSQETAGRLLEERFGVPWRPLGMPIGLRETDEFFKVLEDLTGRITPDRHAAERGRLIDAYVDGHKYIFNKRAVVFGEEDLVVGLVSFLAEIGVKPVLCASGGKSGRLAAAVAEVTGTCCRSPRWSRKGWISLRSPRRPRPWRPISSSATARATIWPSAGRCPWCGSGFPSTTASAAPGFCTWDTGGRKTFWTESSTP